jgi:hypothetical protein
MITYKAFADFLWDAKNEGKLVINWAVYVVKGCVLGMNSVKL